MENTVANLRKLGCPELDEEIPASALISPGETRIKVLEWLMDRMFQPEANPFTAAVDAQAEGADQAYIDNTRVDCLLRGFTALEIPVTVDSIQGTTEPSGDGDEFLQTLSELVVASTCVDNLDGDTAKNVDFLTAVISEKDEILSPEFNVFPTELRLRMNRSTSKSSSESLEVRLEQINSDLEDTRKQLQEMPTLKQDDEVEERMEVGDAAAEVQEKLAYFLQVVKDFNDCYQQALRPWTKVSQPKTYGLGPAAKSTLEQYRQLMQVLADLHSMRDTEAKVKGLVEGPVWVDSSGLPHRRFASLAQVMEHCDTCLTAIQEAMHSHQLQP